MTPSRAIRNLEALDAGAIDSARRGSADAVSTVVNSCRSYLLLVAERELSRNLRAKVGASDIVQETLIKAAERFSQFRGEQRLELLAWLRAILLREIFTARRRFEEAQKRDAHLEVPLHNEDTGISCSQLSTREPSPSLQAIVNERTAQIDRVLGKLPVDYQTVIRLRYWEHLSLAEIGDRIQRSPEAARKLWARAVDRLAAEWEGVYGAEESAD